MDIDVPSAVEVFTALCYINVHLLTYLITYLLTVTDIITKFLGHRPMIERETRFQNGYAGVNGC